MNKATLRKLQSLEERLLEAPRIVLFGRDDWRANVPAAGGVYAIWKKRSRLPVYVGETCHLNHRFGDIDKPNRHTFYKKGLALVGSRARRTQSVQRIFSKHYLIGYLVVDFGRTELEEYLVVMWSDRLVNQIPRRLLLAESYGS